MSKLLLSDVNNFLEKFAVPSDHTDSEESEEELSSSQVIVKKQASVVAKLPVDLISSDQIETKEIELLKAVKKTEKPQIEIKEILQEEKSKVLNEQVQEITEKEINEEDVTVSHEIEVPSITVVKPDQIKSKAIFSKMFEQNTVFASNTKPNTQERKQSNPFEKYNENMNKMNVGGFSEIVFDAEDTIEEVTVEDRKPVEEPKQVETKSTSFIEHLNKLLLVVF